MPGRSAHRLLALSCVAGLALAACTLGDSSTTSTSTPTPSPSAPDPTPIEGAKLYTSTAAGFTVSYPQEWQSQEGVEGAVVAFRSPQEGTKDRFRDNVTILTQSVPEGSTLEQYTAASLNQLEGTVEGYKLLSEGVGFLGANQGHTLVYEAEYKGTFLQLQATYVMDGETVYLVTYTANRGSFDAYETDAETVFDSFTLL